LLRCVIALESSAGGVGAEMFYKLEDALFGGFEGFVFLAEEGIIEGPMDGGGKDGCQEA